MGWTINYTQHPSSQSHPIYQSCIPHPLQVVFPPHHGQSSPLSPRPVTQCWPPTQSRPPDTTLWCWQNFNVFCPEGVGSHYSGSNVYTVAVVRVHREWQYIIQGERILHRVIVYCTEWQLSAQSDSIVHRVTVGKVKKMLHICQGNCFCESSGTSFAKAKVLYCYGEVSTSEYYFGLGCAKLRST